ncbi:unnamed protein product [Lampetra planeri]
MGNSLSGEGGTASSALPSLGLGAPLHVTLLGLDSAGKTALLYRLKLGEFLHTTPTVSFNTERLRLQHAPGLAVSFHFWDVGGQEKLRPLWRSYVRGADGLVFVADASDPERLEEARCELLRVSRLPECQGVPVLVAASKSDLPGALPADEVGRRVGATQLSPHTAWRAQAVSARTGAGVAEALHQLHEVIAEGRRLARMHKRKRPR